MKLKFLSFLMFSLVLLSFSVKAVQADVLTSSEKIKTIKMDHNLADDESDDEEEEERF